MAITHHPEYLTVEEYAKLCNVQPRSVKNRLHTGTLSAILLDGNYFIHAKSNPPVKYSYTKKKHRKGTVIQPDKNLYSVIQWSGRKHIRAYPFLRAIILGHIDAHVYGDEVFASLSDLEAYHALKSAEPTSRAKQARKKQVTTQTT